MSKAQCPQISRTLFRRLKLSLTFREHTPSFQDVSNFLLTGPTGWYISADTYPVVSHLRKNSRSHPVSKILPMTWKSNSHRKFWYLHRLRWKCRQQSYSDLFWQRSLVLFLNRDELSEFSSPEINMRKTFSPQHEGLSNTYHGMFQP